MREILFRAKRIDNGEWVEGLLIKGKYLDCNIDSQSLGMFIPYYYIFAKNEKDWTSPYRKFLVKEQTIGQFTGKCDKNGKKIFEGDIHCNFDNVQKRKRYFIVRFGEFHDTVYGFDSYGWFFEEINGTNIESFEENESDYVIIIGNIHDNPELLNNN